ncbi:ATP11 protein-domain-containing protein [Pavlovales sp. CCMP2436]|nr:ATP11 protein-domain-containing protein [Pavlovales sp. CCMP2436]|mmetsp:Transcript_40829/g.94588  ORF Transcript_40829/g.94588 Transcript_40829/m.94588 type:complete len:225 (+) Transcript_40829:212-886(+)
MAVVVLGRIARSFGGAGLALAAWPRHRTLGSPSRALSNLAALALGVSRRLGEIVKLELLEAESGPVVKKVWEEYHAESEAACGVTVDAAQYAMLMERLKDSPMFIAPVRRGEGFFVLAMQHKEQSLCLTFLEEFKKSPETATPWVFATLYDDLLESKGLALLRADFMPHLITKEEVAKTLSQLLTTYTSDRYDRIWIFNHAPKFFKVDEYLDECGCTVGSKKDE